MSDFETKPVSPAPDANSADIQLQLTILLVGLIVLSAAFAGYMWSTVRQRDADFKNLQTAAAPMVQGYNREKATVDRFIARVIDYSKTHPDFDPIMRKYQLQAIGGGTAPAAAGTAAPASAPKK